MGQSKIVTIGPAFILSDVYLAVAVIIAKIKASYYMHDNQWKLNPIKFAFLFSIGAVSTVVPLVNAPIMYLAHEPSRHSIDLVQTLP